MYRATKSTINTPWVPPPLYTPRSWRNTRNGPTVDFPPVKLQLRVRKLPSFPRKLFWLETHEYVTQLSFLPAGLYNETTRLRSADVCLHDHVNFANNIAELLFFADLYTGNSIPDASIIWMIRERPFHDNALDLFMREIG